MSGLTQTPIEQRTEFNEMGADIFGLTCAWVAMIYGESERGRSNSPGARPTIATTLQPTGAMLAEVTIIPQA